MSAIREWGELIQRMAESVGEKFTEPDDDWTTVGFMRDAEGQTTVVAIDPYLLAPERKHAFYEMLAQVLRKMGSDRVAILASAWTVEAKGRTREEAQAYRQTLPTDLGEVPGRREVLTLTYADISGEYAAMSEIKRTDDGPPTLGEWEDIGEKFLGNLRDLVRAAVAP